MFQSYGTFITDSVLYFDEYYHVIIFDLCYHISFGVFLRNDYIRGFGREIRDGLSFYFLKKTYKNSPSQKCNYI